MNNINWILVAEIAYGIILFFVCLRIIYDTRSTTKSLAYLLFAIFVPIVGIIFYFSFGINYRKNKMYSKKLIADEALAQKISHGVKKHSINTIQEHATTLNQNQELVRMLLRDQGSPITSSNQVILLINGEEKFPAIFEAIEKAKHHIHIEYYIYDDDIVGRRLEALMIKKAAEGVEVRFIYDDFGSSSIRKRLVKNLINHGVQAFPFLKISFIGLANRLNYRNHRKIIVVDGKEAFVGGINVSDKYINNSDNDNKLYWRDTHLHIKGEGAYYLQYLFFCDWNFCAEQSLQPTFQYFPEPGSNIAGNKLVQIAASGPDSDTPAIMYSIMQAINLAQKEILITSPYFIPGESVLDALVIAALSGIKVKLLVPGVSDSRLVNFAARSYYRELLNAGVEIYLYTKGFVHAKTIVADNIAIVGTANMDFRSFDLNFEVNAIVYDEETALLLRKAFYQDIEDSEKIEYAKWITRPVYIRIMEKTARLLSPLL